MNATKILGQAGSGSKGIAKATAKANGKGKLPLFFAFCPDNVTSSSDPGSDSDVFATRLRVRPKHFERVEEDKKAGILGFGRGFLPPSESPLFSHPATADLPNKQPMAGSIMFFRYPSIEDTWKRVREDVYWTEGVWDKDRVQVGEFLRVPSDDEE
ncbi:hypothetical protein IAU59_003673 [Kwoniella sp. CBS 9459]